MTACTSERQHRRSAVHRLREYCPVRVRIACGRGGRLPAGRGTCTVSDSGRRRAGRGLNSGAAAVTARRPRTRYAVGRGAKPILAARRLLSDRAFDRLMNATLRVLVRTAARRTARQQRLA